MPSTLNNYVTQPNYTDAGTLKSSGGVRVRLQISGAAVYWEWCPSPVAQDWNEEEQLLPGLFTFQARIGACRFRDYVAGTHANVTATILYPDDLA